MTLDQITVGMEQLINAKASEILSSKPQDQHYLNWRDMQEVCLVVKSACVKQFNEVPQGVEMACYLAEAVLAPDKKAKLKLMKQVISLTSGTTGIAIILAGVGAALGWGGGHCHDRYCFFHWNIHVGAHRCYGWRRHAGRYCRVFHF